MKRILLKFNTIRLERKNTNNFKNYWKKQRGIKNKTILFQWTKALSLGSASKTKQTKSRKLSARHSTSKADISTLAAQVSSTQWIQRHATNSATPFQIGSANKSVFVLVI